MRIVKSSSREVKALGEVLGGEVHDDTIFEIPERSIIMTFIFELGGKVVDFFFSSFIVKKRDGFFTRTLFIDT